jgi:hypothetical protein
MGPPGCSVPAASLPPEASSYLKAKLSFVYLSRASLDKICSHHPDLTDYNLVMIPHVLEHGTLLTDRKPNVVIAYGRAGAKGRLYKATVKLAASGYDVWLTAFYRTDDRHISSLRERAVILKQGL